MSSTGSKVEAALPVIALTAGEPAGIGPDLLIAAAQRRFDARLIAYTDPALLHERARRLGVRITIVETQPAETPAHAPGRLAVSPVPLAAGAVPGQLDPANGDAVLESIRRAVRAVQDTDCAGLVTGPVHKALINQSGTKFSGHTEFIGDLCGAIPVMMLMNETMRVVLVTTHLPLARVSAALTREKLEQVIAIAERDLRTRFGIATPSLLVCGLNPHAGEDGTLGDEEDDVIIPVLEKLRRRGLDLTGPVAADTAFTPASLEGRDAVIAMYHDQGLAPLKAVGFGGIVNVTLGLPIIRTSVDHGTALPLAGSGRARPESMIAAIDLAMRLARSSAEQCAATDDPIVPASA